MLNRIVVQSVEPGAIDFFVVFTFDQFDCCDIPAFCRRYPKVSNSLLVLINDFRVILEGFASTVCELVGDKCRIDNPVVFLEIVVVQQLEHLSTDQLIVSVYKHLDLVIAAEIVGAVDDVVGREVPLQVLHVHDALLGKLLSPHEAHRLCHRVVVGQVVHEHNVVVGVVLLQDAQHDFLVSAVLEVVVAGHKDTER